MINTRYSSQQILTLFGRKAEGAAQAQASPDRLKAVSDLAKQAKAGAAATATAVVDEVNPSEIVVPEGHVYETRAEYEARSSAAWGHDTPTRPGHDQTHLVGHGCRAD